MALGARQDAGGRTGFAVTRALGGCGIVCAHSQQSRIHSRGIQWTQPVAVQHRSTQGGYTGKRLVDFYQDLQQRLAILPGVRSVSMSEHTLIGGWRDTNGINVPGYALKPDQKGQAVMVPTNWVGPRFLETMGIPLLLGRTIGEGDREGAPKVAVVNKKFVREFLGEGNPIGRRFGFGGRDAKADIEIVGVAGDAKFTDLRNEVPPTIYGPILQNLGLLGSYQCTLSCAPKATRCEWLRLSGA